MVVVVVVVLVVAAAVVAVCTRGKSTYHVSESYQYSNEGNDPATHIV